MMAEAPPASRLAARAPAITADALRTRYPNPPPRNTTRASGGTFMLGSQPRGLGVVDLVQACSVQVRIVQVRPVQVGLAQISPAEVGTEQVREAEVHSAQIGRDQLRPPPAGSPD